MRNKGKINLRKHDSANALKWLALNDAWVATAFAGAIAVLLLAACYVASRLSAERAHREKWQDYNDCGWA